MGINIEAERIVNNWNLKYKKGQKVEVNIPGKVTWYEETKSKAILYYKEDPIIYITGHVLPVPMKYVKIMEE